MTGTLQVARWVLEAALLSGGLYVVTRLTKSRIVTILTFASAAARLLIGEALFVVSAFNLPLLTELHVSGGFWQLAPDAAGYDLAARQLMGLADNTGLSSEAITDPFISTVVGMYTLFGVHPSAILIFNAFVAAGCIPPLSWPIARQPS